MIIRLLYWCSMALGYTPWNDSTDAIYTAESTAGVSFSFIMSFNYITVDLICKTVAHEIHCSKVQELDCPITLYSTINLIPFNWMYKSILFRHPLFRILSLQRKWAFTIPAISIHLQWKEGRYRTNILMLLNISQNRHIQRIKLQGPGQVIQ